ncbi:hypothetical protein C0J45_5356 [Silurus meridionalis]|nr:hypothetical protein C0J45_5356 [Silurus meridionalis]
MEARLVVAVVVLLCTFGGFTEAQTQISSQISTNITRTGCGTTKLCMSSVNGCDPSGNSSCFFSSTQLNNTILTVELSGTTLGYVALGLTPTTSQILQFLGLNNVVLACGNNNNSLFYQTTSLQSGTLQTSVSVPNGTIFTVQGSILTNTAIQCIFNFNITNLYQLFPSGSAVQLPFNVNILNGTTNGTQLGTPNTVFNSNGPLDLANPKSTVPTAPSTLNITRTGCGTTKLCMSSVNGCDPSGNSSCFFSSTQLNNTILTVELSGTTLGYVALGLTPTTSQIQQSLGLNNVVLVCHNYYNYGVFYQATSLQSGTFQTSVSVPNISISNFQGSFLTNTAIQCIFNFNIPNLYQLFPSGSAVQLPFNVTILNGTTNGTQLGTPNTVFNSNGPLDLANPKSTVPTPAPSTPSTINITRTGCGTTKLCLSNSSTCDPSGNSSCFFTSFQVVNQNFSFELSGMTSGYIALALIKPPSTQAFVFVCGNNASVNSSNFFFVTATKSGTSLNVTTVNTVYSVQGIVANSQTLIQCLFNTSTTFAVSTKSDTTTYQALIMSGTTNGTNLGDPTVRADTVVAIDLSNVTALNTTPNSANAISSFCTKGLELKPKNIPPDISKNIPQNISMNIPQAFPQDIPQDIPKNIPQDIPKNIPQDILQDIPKNIPQDILQDIPKNIPQDIPKNIPQDIPQDIPKNIPQDIPKNILQDIPKNIPQDIPKNIPQDIPKNIPKNIPQDIPQDIPKNIPQDIPKNIPQDIPQDIVQDIPKNIPQDIPKNIPQDILQDIPQDILQNIPQDILQDIPKNIPQDILQDIPKNIPQDIPKDIFQDILQDIPQDIPQDVLIYSVISGINNVTGNNNKISGLVAFYQLTPM